VITEPSAPEVECRQEHASLQMLKQRHGIDYDIYASYRFVEL
jgi:hypothetical protein